MVDGAGLDRLNAPLNELLATARELSTGFHPEEAGSGGQELDAVRRRLDGVTATLDQLATLVQELRARTDRATAVWRERVRFDADGLRATIAQVDELAQHDAKRATARLLSEVAAAVYSLEKAAAAHLLAAAPPACSVSTIASQMSNWAEHDNQGDGRAALETLREMARGQRLGAEERRQLALTAAWLNRRSGEPDGAVAIVDRLCRDEPRGAVAHAEFAGLLLTLGQSERATEAARRAVELDPQNGRAILQLGACSEATADYRDADDLYQEGCGRLDRSTLGRIGHGVTFLSPTGLMRLAAARRLEALGDVDAALAAIEAALAVGVVGERPYPDADAYELRASLLEGRKESVEATGQAALEAGKRHLWNKDARAVPMLRLAVQAGDRIPDAGWYLASALWFTATSRPEDFDQALAAEAQTAWDTWRLQVGTPDRPVAWAYPLRADVAHRIATATAGDSDEAAWAGVLLCEKALVLDRLNAYAFAICAALFRQLTHDQLALQCADSGYAADPDEPIVLAERVALLSGAGRFDEALETIARIPTADTDPWYRYVRAWLLFHQGNPAEALPHMDQALSAPILRGWILDMRVYCYVMLGRFDDALADQREILELEIADIDNDRPRRAWARLILEGTEAAFLELRSIEPSRKRSDLRVAGFEAGAALAGGDADEALRAFDVALALCSTRREADDLLLALQNAATLLAHAGRAVPEAEGVLTALQARLRRWEPPVLPTPEEELSAILMDHADDPPGSSAQAALKATRARLLRTAGDLTSAAAEYDAAQAGPFEPEATLGLGDVLVDQFNVAVEEGDPERTASLFSRLQELDRAPVPFVEVAVADALRAVGRTKEGITQLSAVAGRATSAPDRLAVYARLGDCALREADLDLAQSSFSQAAEAATELGDRWRAASLRVRLGVAWGLAGSPGAAVEQFRQAIELWAKGGAVDPPAILLQEVDWLLHALSPDQFSTLTGTVMETAQALVAERPSPSGAEAWRS